MHSECAELCSSMGGFHGEVYISEVANCNFILIFMHKNNASPALVSRGWETNVLQPLSVGAGNMDSF